MKKTFLYVGLISFGVVIGTIGNIKYNQNSNKRLNNKTAIYINNGDGYKPSTSKKLPTVGYELDIENTTCTDGVTVSQNSETKLLNVNATKSGSCKFYFESSSLKTLKTLGLENRVQSGTPNFGNVATTDEGIFKTSDYDGEDTYYFRGAITNNYVYFAGFYWRIIRVNSDGSLRIIYDGTSKHSNGESSRDRLALTNIQWNDKYDDAKYVGYMFGGASGTASTSKLGAQTNETSSNIKTQLETWYTETIGNNSSYANAVDVNGVFCNDRSTSGQGYGKPSSSFDYGAYTRNYTNKSPEITCPNNAVSSNNDLFSKGTGKAGNGKLGQPVGLITADEIAFAGGKWATTNTSYYLYKGSWYWSFSPYYMGSSSADVFYVASSGALYSYVVNGEGGVAPVINLTTEYSRNLINSEKYGAFTTEN